jgi:hypothetical protein
MTEAKWIRFVHSQEQIKEILDYCAEEKRKERKKVRKEIIAMLDKLYEQKYDSSPCNRTDDGGMYNNGELDLISEIKNMINRRGEPE